MQVNSRFKKVGDLAREAFVDLGKMQKGESLLLKTGFDMFDCHLGGLLPKDVITIAGASGTGKSETLYKLQDNIMSLEINPKADNYISLDYSLEMPMLNKIMRKLHTDLGKSKSSILLEQFSEDEKAKVARYFESLKDDRRFVINEPTAPSDFYNDCRQVCLENKGKDAIIISLDHSLLLKGGDKQKAIEDLTEYINLLRGEFNNVYFIILTQLNRSHSALIKERSNDMRPNNSWIYGSSFVEHLSSYIVIITNPFKQGVDNYLKVYKNRYEYLTDFVSETDSKDRVSFDTVGNLFYFVTKIRESDNDFKDLFIERMNLTQEQLEKMKMRREEKEVPGEMSFPEIPEFSNDLPVFKPEDVF